MRPLLPHIRSWGNCFQEIKVASLKVDPAELHPASEEPPSRTDPRCFRSQHNENGNLNARVKQIEQKILSIDVVDVTLIGIGPALRPRIH